MPVCVCFSPSFIPVKVNSVLSYFSANMNFWASAERCRHTSKYKYKKYWMLPTTAAVHCKGVGYSGVWQKCAGFICLCHCFTPQTNMPINILTNAKCYCNNNKERGQYIRVITESLWQRRRRAGTHFLLPSAEGVKSIIRFGACILIRKDCVNGAGMLAAASCWL